MIHAEVRETPPARVVMLGSFPPPVGGAARNNAMIAQSLLDSGVDLRKINVSGTTASHYRTLAYHARRVTRNLIALTKAVISARRDSMLYIVPDGGLGAWYTLGHVRVSGGGYGKLVLHHHTFLYINHWSRPVAAFTDAHREKATHIFLSEGMARQFQDRYGEVRYRVASNARFVADEAERDAGPRRPGPLRLGHLSNLSDDKGFFETADTFDALAEQGIEAELHFAGPVLSEEVEARLAGLLEHFPGRVVHHGPVFGTEKRNFYRDIDLFVFPTNFDQEAAPSVVYEALAAGRPVLTVNRGCIPEIVCEDCGAILPARQGFAPAAVDFIRGFDAGADAVAARAARIKAIMRGRAEQSRVQYAELMQAMGAKRPAHFVQEY